MARAIVAEVREAERGADRDPGNLADRAAGQAVERRADRDGGQRRALGRHPMVSWCAVASMCFRLTQYYIPPRGIWERPIRSAPESSCIAARARAG